MAKETAMNQSTKAFLMQLVALCDAYGVSFYVARDPDDDTHRNEGVVIRGPYNYNRKNPRP